jgi:hypothetical protein
MKFNVPSEYIFQFLDLRDHVNFANTCKEAKKSSSKKLAWNKHVVLPINYPNGKIPLNYIPSLDISMVTNLNVDFFKKMQNIQNLVMSSYYMNFDVLDFIYSKMETLQSLQVGTLMSFGFNIHNLTILYGKNLNTLKIDKLPHSTYNKVNKFLKDLSITELCILEDLKKLRFFPNLERLQLKVYHFEEKMIEELNKLSHLKIVKIKSLNHIKKIHVKNIKFELYINKKKIS